MVKGIQQLKGASPQRTKPAAQKQSSGGAVASEVVPSFLPRYQAAADHMLRAAWLPGLGTFLCHHVQY